MSKRSNAFAIAKYGRTGIGDVNNNVYRSNAKSFNDKKELLMSEVGVFKQPSTNKRTTISNATLPIAYEPIRPDEPSTYKKHKLVSKLGYHGRPLEGCRFVELNTGWFIEPLMEHARTVYSRIELEQFRLLCRLYAEQFVARHGYISQVGLRKMLRDSGRVIVSNDIIRDVVTVMQANEPSMKHNGRTVDNSVCTWCRDIADYNEAEKQRLKHIIECCSR